MDAQMPNGFAATTRPTSNQRNKTRLYLMFYRQNRQWEEGVKFHAALTVVPKRPDPSKVQTWRFHVRDTMREQGIVGWGYEGTQTVNYDQRMVAAVLLCKLDPSVTVVGLSMLLREVAVNEDAEDRSARLWILNAIRLIVERKVIPPFPLSSQTIWDKGYKFAETVENLDDSTVPTCDITGEMIKSEISRA